MMSRHAISLALLISIVFALSGCGCGNHKEIASNTQVANVDNDVFELKELGLVFRRIPMDEEIDGVGELFLSETEVTNAMYKHYLNKTGKTKLDKLPDDFGQPHPLDTEDRRHVRIRRFGPVVHNVESLWRQNDFPEGKHDHPVAFVTILEAIEFADWLNKRFKRAGTFRLPMEKEWLWAAYGRSRPSPWGDTEQSLRYGETTPVKACPNLRTPDGVYGMWGNVAEIVHSRSNGYGSESDDYLREPGMTKWLGESFVPSDVFGKTLAPRQDYWGYSHASWFRGDHVGFRVAFIPDGKEE